MISTIERQPVAEAVVAGLAYVVDDVEGNRILAAAYLELLGWSVETFADALGALAAVRRRVPEAMLVDMRMPHMSGEQLARLLKSDARRSGIRLVGYTAHALTEEIDRVRAAGFDEVLTKPALMADMQRVFTRAP